MKHSPILLLFVDGLGLGEPDPEVNPIHDGVCPCLEAFLDQADPVDACLGVSGLPQSATGQTALLTGRNAPKEMGRHIEGFPGPSLRAIIEADNIFHAYKRRGLRATFANAYFVKTMDEVHAMRVHSVTTVATLSAFGVVRDRSMLEANRAVYQDLTRELLVKRGYTGPLITPEEAAADLLRIVRDHDLTLFEYFQTDRVGHACDPARIHQVLGLLNRFLEELLEATQAESFTLVLVSDHGNIEDIRTRAHTLNPVPFAVAGSGADQLKGRAKSLTDIFPLILDMSDVLTSCR